MPRVWRCGWIVRRALEAHLLRRGDELRRQLAEATTLGKRDAYQRVLALSNADDDAGEEELE